MVGLTCFVAVVIAASLKSHCQSDCNIGDTGAAALAAAVENNTNLQHLDLSSSEFFVLCL